MESALSDRWRAISAWLDEALELGPEARATWLVQLEARHPAIATQIKTYLVAIDQLDEQNFLGVPATAMLDASLAGHRFGAYTLERQIGAGGMGTVWLAQRSDGRFEGQAAVKLLNTALVGHPSAGRFAREGSVLARLRHPNIAHLLDAGVAAGSQPYLILEYVHGERIDRYCKARDLDVRARIRLFLDVLSAVAHAHNNLIVHRDIKPSNILVTDEGAVKLLDFGVAALLSPSVETDGSALTHHFAVGLTPGHAAPEQLLGEPVTTATDVYALGIVLFQLLAGRHPLGPEDRSTADLLRATLDLEAPRLSERAGEVPHRHMLRGDLENIVAMALRRNPAERYATADQLAEDLRRYLAFEPVAARPRSAVYLTRMFVRRHRAAVAAACAVAVILVSGIVFTTGQMLDARQQRDRALATSRRAETTKDFLKQLFTTDLGAGHSMRTLYDRLDTAVNVLEQQYRGDPLFMGRMLMELGTDFRDIDETRRANELFQKGYDIGRAQKDVELMTYSQCLRVQSDAYADVRAGVNERLEEAARLLAKIDQPSVELRSRCLRARAAFAQRLGRPAEAEALLLHARQLLEEEGSTIGDIYVTTLANLGYLYFNTNRLREALRMMQLVGETHDRNGRSATYNRLIIRQNVASVLAAIGEVRAALAEREIINARLRELAGPDMGPISLMVNYANVLVRMQRAPTAISVLERTLERARKSGNAIVLSNTLLQKALALVQLERWHEAELALTEAASLTADGIGNRDMGAQVESAMARVDLARRDLESARRHRDRSLELAGYGSDTMEKSLTRVLLVAAEVALADKAPADAERFARDALQIAQPIARGPDTSGDVGEGLLRLAQARIALNAQADVRGALQRAVRCLTNGFGTDHPLTAEARRLLPESPQQHEAAPWNPRLRTDGRKSVPGSTKRSS